MADLGIVQQAAEGAGPSGSLFLPPEGAIQSFPQRGTEPVAPVVPNGADNMPAPPTPGGPFRSYPTQGPRGLTQAQLLPNPQLQAGAYTGGYPADLQDEGVRDALRRDAVMNALSRGGWKAGAITAQGAGMQGLPYLPPDPSQTAVGQIMARRAALGQAMEQTKHSAELEATLKQKAIQEYEQQQDTDPDSSLSKAKRALVKKFLPNIDIPEGVPGAALNQVLGLGEKVYGIDVPAAVQASRVAFERAQAAGKNNLGANWKIPDADVPVPGMPGARMPKVMLKPAGERERAQFIDVQQAGTSVRKVVDQTEKDYDEWNAIHASGRTDKATQDRLTALQSKLGSDFLFLNQQLNAIYQLGRTPQLTQQAVAANAATNPAGLEQKIAGLIGPLANTIDVKRDIKSQLERIKYHTDNSVLSMAHELGAVPTGPEWKREWKNFTLSQIPAGTPEPELRRYLRDEVGLTDPEVEEFLRQEQRPEQAKAAAPTDAGSGKPQPGDRVPSSHLGLPPGGVFELQPNGKWKRVE